MHIDGCGCDGELVQCSISYCTFLNQFLAQYNVEDQTDTIVSENHLCFSLSSQVLFLFPSFETQAT